MNAERSRPFLAVGAGGFLVGVFDLAFAFLFYGARGITPVAILHSIASGWIGRAAVTGGAASAALGLVTHFLIAFGAASVYFLASRRFPVLWKHAVPMGILFGAGFYVFMNFVVIPLSAFPFEPTYPLRTVLPAVAVHMFLIGLPIALSVRRFAGGVRS
jgi:hypothetical protein